MPLGDTRITISDGSLCVAGIRAFDQPAREKTLGGEAHGTLTITRIDILPIGAHLVRGKQPFRRVEVICDRGTIVLSADTGADKPSVTWTPSGSGACDWKSRHNQLRTPEGKIHAVIVDGALRYDARDEKVAVRVWYRAQARRRRDRRAAAAKAQAV